jgi:dipeptide/tripeptide permease
MALAVVAFLLLMVFGWMGGDAGAIRGSPYVGKAATYGSLLDPVGGNLFRGLYESWVGSDVGRMTPWALIGGYAIITLGELCLSPMGLSLVSKLAAPRQRSAWMGGWFAATAVGGYLSGLIGGFWDTWPHSTFFAFLAGTSLFAGLLLVLFYRRLRDAMPTAKSPSS